MYKRQNEGFVKMMNEKAKELKLKNTHFMNPTGLHAVSYTHLDVYKRQEHMYNFAKASSEEYRALGIATALGPQMDLALSLIHILNCVV